MVVFHIQDCVQTDTLVEIRIHGLRMAVVQTLRIECKLGTKRNGNRSVCRTGSPKEYRVFFIHFMHDGVASALLHDTTFPESISHGGFIRTRLLSIRRSKRTGSQTFSQVEFSALGTEPRIFPVVISMNPVEDMFIDIDFRSN